MSRAEGGMPLAGKVALVAGATRGAGRAIAVELARAGAVVYATGRSSRASGPSGVGRPETIEETGDLIAAAGGEGTALRVDHLEPGQVEKLVRRIDQDHGRLDVLVNDIFDGGRYSEFGAKLWEQDLTGGLRLLQPLRPAPADPAAGRAGARADRRDRRVQRGRPPSRGLLRRD
jgi:NAD(P)-dependent dehydrogenase (short-subunit alcohol dehydrogenase family)